MSYDFRKWQANELERGARSPRLAWYIGSAIGLALLAPTLALLDPDPDDTIVSMVFFFPLLIALGFSPFARDGLSLNARARKSYDEFERDALARATRRAYTWLVALTFALLAYVWIGVQAGWRVPATPHQWSAVGLAFLFVGAALPVLFAELMVPLPPEGDEMED